MKCLFLLCLCLVPIVVFSSTFTSQNPINLPSDATPVLDVTGKELDPRLSYRIISIGRGALGGDVYLGKSPNSDAPCANGVFRYNSDVGPSGTPVRFIGSSSHFGPHIFEDELLNIQFAISTSKLCVSYTIWKVGDYDASLGTMLLETGGTIGQADSSWFKIVKSSHLVPLIVLSISSDDQFCLKIGVVHQMEKDVWLLLRTILLMSPSKQVQ
uniref:Putative kunitz-type proteinase inhibitor P1D4 n=1 Tax=Solanum tuberosum TaxID=4113 RepID=Q8S381_SOLTU|nr:putative kunitz-type proteinase inhibitor precursor P1D4 [Solanum tuberosum]